MGPNPFLGVVYHWIGGLAAASFYIPYRGVKKWSWETYWLVGGVFSWIIAPWIMAMLLVPNVWGAIQSTPPKSLFWTYFFGALWGLGGLTFGLTMRYLGIALGYAIALGLCATFGTLVPPIVGGEIGEIAASAPGRMILLGVFVCLAGISISGMAGISKERELPAAEKKASVEEFNFAKGLTVALLAGVLSACMAYGLASGKPLAEITKANLLANGRSDLWQSLPVLIIVLAGGFTTNFFYCLFLNIKNRSGHEYLNLRRSAVTEVSATEAVVPWDADELASETQNATSEAATNGATPLLANYLFSALAGITWYLQFFFYSMGQTKMGKYEFSSWTLHMASIIIFSTLWGIALKEWKGTSRRTLTLVAFGLLVLIGSTVVIGYGNFLKAGAGS